jgi:NADH dehydrogenase FAD-containing subunit
MLGGTYRPEEIRFATQRVVETQGGQFILDHATHIDPDQQQVFLKSGQNLSYDVLSFNAGSSVPRDLAPPDHPNLFTVKPIERLLEAQERINTLSRQGPLRIGIIGGGPSAAELAGNIHQLVPSNSPHLITIQVFCGRALMKDFPSAVRGRIHQNLTRRGIVLVENDYVTAITDEEIHLESGGTHGIDLVFMALGVKPSGIFQASGLPIGPDGGLRVNQFLQSTAHPNLFGGGDCIYFQDQPLDKVGVYAVRENPILYHNLMATLDGRSDLQPFDPGGDYLLIFNLGDGEGVLRKGWLTFGGRLAFKIKDYIDRRFMDKFQKIEA